MSSSSISRAAIGVLLAAIVATCMAGGAEATVSMKSKIHKVPIPPATRKICFWHENNGTAFGISGQCYVGQATPVGAPCDCDRTVEHAVQHHAGQVIEVPQGGGSPPVIH